MPQSQHLFPIVLLVCTGLRKGGQLHGIEACGLLGLTFYLPGCLVVLPICLLLQAEPIEQQTGLPMHGPRLKWHCLTGWVFHQVGTWSTQKQDHMCFGAITCYRRDPTSEEPSPWGRRINSNWVTWDLVGKIVMGQVHGSSKSCFSHYFSLLK